MGHNYTIFRGIGAMISSFIVFVISVVMLFKSDETENAIVYILIAVVIFFIGLLMVQSGISEKNKARSTQEENDKLKLRVKELEKAVEDKDKRI